jgi:16S rRNA (cytosine967-C5)-methyltransferase
VTPARRAAFEVLLAVEAGAAASDRLDQRAAGLSSRDAGLATELVFGCLRRRAQLDWLLAKASSRPLDRLNREVLAALRLGAYQMRFLTRVPAHAALSESVDLVKRGKLAAAAGFVNAVLRRLPELPEKWVREELRYSMPGWLLARWRAAYGSEAAVGVAAAALQPPEPWLRVPPGRAVLETDLDGPPPEGARRMDIGAQSVVPLLGLEPGHRFLDLCAAPGNKTLQALETPVKAVACDASPARLKSILASNVQKVLLDATLPLPFGPIFDRVLVDAPCSGTGTLGRNPEIRWRLAASDIIRHSGRQKRILRAALACLRPGGRLVYSTCSLEQEENKDVVTAVAAGRVQSEVLRLPGREPGDGFFAAVLE